MLLLRPRVDFAASSRIGHGEVGLDVLIVVVAVVEYPAVRNELDALEVIVELEIDDAGNRIRAVDGGRAAGQHIDAIDQRRGNDVDVGTVITLRTRVAIAQSIAVDQDQGALGIEAAQIHRRRGAGAAVDDVAALIGKHLRIVQQIGNLA